MAGQTADFCPADKKLYALRDVTGTVPSRELIIASIMSKKLAESLDRLVLDVKFGPGAFMKTREDAQKLAFGLQSAGQENNVITRFLFTAMAEPLGETVGSALEVKEAVDTLQGKGPPDFVKLTLDLCERVADSPRERLAGWLQDGTAWKKFAAMVSAQGGDASALPTRLTAPSVSAASVNAASISPKESPSFSSMPAPAQLSNWRGMTWPQPFRSQGRSCLRLLFPREPVVFTTRQVAQGRELSNARIDPSGKRVQPLRIVSKPRPMGISPQFFP